MIVTLLSSVQINLFDNGDRYHRDTAVRDYTEVSHIGGSCDEIPHQAAVMRFGFSFTLAPTKTAGMGVK